MKTIATVIWVIGWPLAYDLGRYLGALTRRVENRPPETESGRGFGSILCLTIWIVGLMVLSV